MTEEIKRKFDEIVFFCLFTSLWNLANKKTQNKGYKKSKDLKCTKEEIKGILRDQYVVEEDLDKGIDFCIKREWLFKNGESFSPTESATASYHAELRRV